MKSKKKVAWIVGLALVAVLAIAGSVQAVSVQVFAPETDHSDETPAKTLDSEFGSTFSVLKNSKGREALPDRAKKLLAHGFTEVNGNIDLAVAVPNSVTPGPVIVVPGDKGLCVAVPDSQGGYSAGCWSRDAVAAGKASVSDGDINVTLAPDGVETVSVVSATGRQVSDTVENNIAVNRLAKPAEIKVGDKRVDLFK